MRRLAAILLMLWACVLAPVLPLVAAQPDEQPAVCACCKGGPCQHNACPIPATAGSLLCPVEASVRLAPTPARRGETAVRRQLKGIVFVERDTAAAPSTGASTWPVEMRPGAVGAVPLFTAHCSRLI